jgi:hypothetical protein
MGWAMSFPIRESLVHILCTNLRDPRSRTSTRDTMDSSSNNDVRLVAFAGRTLKYTST